MLKVAKVLGRPWSLIGCRVLHQSFSVTFMGGKQFDPPAFDMVIKEIESEDLHGKISKYLEKAYLSPLQDDEKEFKEIRKGIIYGVGNRSLISIPTRSNWSKPVWVHYIVNPASPYTYLSEETCKALNINRPYFRLFINNTTISASLS